MPEYSGTPLTDQTLKRFRFYNEADEIIEFAPGQKEIMECIFQRSAPNGSRRVQVETTTQYGKSKSIGSAVAVRAATVPGDRWSLVAGSTDKARIIMEAAILSTLQDPILRSQIIYTGEGSVDRLRQEKSKDRLTYKKGGEIRVFSTDARNKQASGDALMGFGSPNSIQDESALIDDEMEAKNLRMLGGFGDDGFYMKVGNPFRRNHFLTSHNDPRFYKIWIDWQRAVQEGRLTAQFVDEMRNKPFFDIFYEVLFPREDVMDPGGWMPLLTEDDVLSAITTEFYGFGEKRLGADVAGAGRNFSVQVIRQPNVARIHQKINQPDTMKFATAIVATKQAEGIKNRNVIIDDNGLGKGVYDRGNELVSSPFHPGETLTAARVGDKSANPIFANVRAELMWSVREWIKGGGMLLLEEEANGDPKKSDWLQLAQIKYRAISGQKLQIMPKLLMLKEGIDSPDVADALSFTFRGATVKESSDDISGGEGVVDSAVEFDPYALPSV